MDETPTTPEPTESEASTTEPGDTVTEPESTAPENTEPESAAHDAEFNRAATVRFTVFYVLGWVLLLLALAVAEVALDPDLDSITSEILNAASSFILAIGCVAVPFGVGFYAYGHHAGWGRTAAFAVGALVAFLIGVVLDLGVYKLLTGS